MNFPKRPLAGCIVNLSISEGEDSTRHGFPRWQVNRITLQIVVALLGQGAGVIFGHDWREDGIMASVYGFARQVQSPFSASANGSAEIALLQNFLPWPESPALSEDELRKLSPTLRVDRVGLPPELQAIDYKAQQSDHHGPLYRYVRARGLTFLRQRLTDACHVRLCVGGRRSGYSGRYPGVIEEAFLAVKTQKPLYLASFLGGATEQLVSAIDGEPMNEGFCPPTGIEDLYSHPPVTESDHATLEDRVVDRATVWKEFAAGKYEGVAFSNGLTDSENHELLHTSAIDRAIELILNGLSKFWHDLQAKGHK